MYEKLKMVASDLYLNSSELSIALFNEHNREMERLKKKKDVHVV